MSAVVGWVSARKAVASCVVHGWVAPGRRFWAKAEDDADKHNEEQHPTEKENS